MQLPYTLTTEAIHHGTEPDAPTWFAKAHDDDAAYDLRAAESLNLYPFTPALIKTGVRVAIPEGYAGLVLPRSGLAAKHSITVLNSPGLIDPGYRGEISVVLIKLEGHQAKDFHPIRAGDRIAQLLLIKTANLTPVYKSESVFNVIAAATERGEGGFGSTGR